ncbi:hypothetical protein GWK47_017864 [Chionoecetes opilio]|uniref:Fucosyltransferase n=1 Tax=Chionoecetes opilio TaxID=41210 RepID=A0A8J5BY89_CHIOP|nr:hypothetical protein GWK47_017864 [Chionoecetes opilio]
MRVASWARAVRCVSPRRLDVVPVVFGLGDYAVQAPPHSYIDALSFPSTNALADYLLYLNHNNTAYNEYFRLAPALSAYVWKVSLPCSVLRKALLHSLLMLQHILHGLYRWKRFHQVIDGWAMVSQQYCALCEMLHNDTPTKTYDLQKWYAEGGHCKTPPVPPRYPSWLEWEMTCS